MNYLFHDDLNHGLNRQQLKLKFLIHQIFYKIACSDKEKPKDKQIIIIIIIKIHYDLYY